MSRIALVEPEPPSYHVYSRFYSLRECAKSFASLHLRDGAVKTYAWNLMRRAKADAGRFVERLRYREAGLSPSSG